MSTRRRSISTNVPYIGRSDQRESAPTWNRLTTPLPRCSPVTSGVPSSSVAQLLVASTASGSASTCRLTVTSFGTARPVNGPSAVKAARCCGFSQVRLPPRLRPPRPGKAHQHTTLIDPGSKTFADFGRQRADIGEHDHRELLIEELRDH